MWSCNYIIPLSPTWSQNLRKKSSELITYSQFRTVELFIIKLRQIVYHFWKKKHYQIEKKPGRKKVWETDFHRNPTFFRYTCRSPLWVFTKMISQSESSPANRPLIREKYYSEITQLSIWKSQTFLTYSHGNPLLDLWA